MQAMALDPRFTANLRFQPGADSDEGPYTAQKCLVCGGVHLVNARTGKLMSEEHPPPRPDPR